MLLYYYIILNYTVNYLSVTLHRNDFFLNKIPRLKTISCSMQIATVITWKSEWVRFTRRPF